MGDEITSTDDIDPVPGGPLNENVDWPTPSNLHLDDAVDICDGAIKNSPLYDECVKYTVVDTVAYVNSCIADILVTTS